MSAKRVTAPIVLGLVLLLSACHTFRFEISRGPVATPPIVDHKGFFLWALYPTREVDMRTFCPNGVAAIVEETTFTDGLLGVITLSMYTPRTSYYYCRLPQTQTTQAPGSAP